MSNTLYNSPIYSITVEVLMAPLRLVGWLWSHRPKWRRPESPLLAEYMEMVHEDRDPYSERSCMFLEDHRDDLDLQMRARAFRKLILTDYYWSTK
jgi:hypothetical protein